MMHTTTRAVLVEAITTNLVEIGLSPEEAERSVGVVMDAADNALLSLTVTMDIALHPLEGDRNEVPAKHLCLQVLRARLDAIIADLQTDLVADGATTRDIHFGVSSHG